MPVMLPDFIADITLYPPDRGGREPPIIGEWFGCPCKFDPRDFSAWDCRVLVEGEQFKPGETKKLAIVLLTPEALWEGRIIGEAKPIFRQISN
ncbi:MAG: hypothetical protein ABI407_17390 [Bradyrhizobium sp.]